MTAANGPDTPLHTQDGHLLSTGPRQASLPPGPAGDLWIWDAWRDLLLLALSPVWLMGVVLAIQAAEAVAATGDWGFVRAFVRSTEQMGLAPLYLVVVTFLAVGRQLPAFARVYGNRELRALYRTRLVVAPMVLLAVSLASAYLGLEGLTAVLLLWGIWHATTQTYGIMRIYDSKVSSFAASTIWLDYLLAVCWFGAGVLFSSHRMEQLLLVFYACGVPLISPVAAPFLQLVWGGLTVVITTAFVVNYVAQRRQNQRPSLMKLAVMVSSFGFWWFTMVNTEDALLGVLLYEVFRAVQNLVLVRITMLRTVAAGGSIAPWARVFGRPGLLASLVLLAAAALYGVPFYLTKVTPFGMAAGAGTDAMQRAFYGLMAASTMLHFYLEGFTWRLREAGVRQSLGISQAAWTAAPAFRRRAQLPHAVAWALLLIPLALLGWMQWQRGATVDGVPANLAEVIPQSARTHARYGAWLLQQGRANDAVKELTEALAIRPASTEALCDLGRAQRALGRIDLAIEQFEKAVEYDPQSAMAEAELGKTLFGTGDAESGLKHLRTAVELAPHDAKLHYDLGLAQINSGSAEEALASFGQAIALDGSFAVAYNARGMVHMQLTHFDEAIDDFDQAVQLDPQLYKAYRNRARVWERRNQPERAIADLTTLIAASPTSLHYVMRGDVHYGLKQYDQARDDYVAAMQNAARDLDPIIRLANLYLDTAYQDPSLAIEYAKRACQQTNWRDFRALALLATSYAAAGNRAQAAHWQEQALKIVPPDVPEHIKAELRSQVEKYRGDESKPPAPGGAEVPPAPAAPLEPGTGGDATAEPAGT